MATTPGASNWWTLPKGQSVGRAMIGAVVHIQETTLGLQTRMLRAARLFGGYGYMSGGRFPTNIGGSGALGMGSKNGPRENLVYAVVSTVCSQVLDDGAPGVSFLTSHGDYELQHKAELLEQFCDGLFYQVGFDAVLAEVLQDCCIFGTGYAKFFTDADHNIHAERVFPAAVMVDMWDGRDRRPRSLYQVDFIDRDLLASRYPAKRKEIMNLKPQAPVGFNGVTATATNVIPFIEGWHLPTTAEAGDGRHVLTLTDDFTCVDESYEDDDFPFSVLRYETLPTGFHGLGLAELLQGHQMALNDANRAEYWAWSQVAAPRIFMRTGTLDKNHLNSSLSGVILEGNGEPPAVLNWSATHPAFVEWKADIRSNAFALAGTSPLTASGQKPAGLNSGEAQRVFADQQHSRRAVLSIRTQEFKCDAARKVIKLGREVYSKNKAFSVKVLGKAFIKEVKFKDIDLDESEYRLQAKPVNQLPKSVAGQIQTATELAQSNFADVDTARKLITTIPDLGAASDLWNAAQDNAKRTAYLMLHEGKPQTPDPMQNLALCVKVVTAEALRGMDNDAPEDRLDLCRKWLVQAKALLQPEPPPGAAAGGAVQAGPIAAGAAAPPSELLPFKKPGT